MKKIISLTTILIFLSVFGHSQRNISGKVLDGKGNGLMAATCFLKGDRSKVAISDVDGTWIISIAEKDEMDTLEIRYLGFSNSYIPVSDIENGIEKIIRLGESSNIMSEIFITARNPISEDFSVEKIEPLDVYFNPLSKADPLNAIQMLPASTDTEESASPSLRGSSPFRSIVVVDGVPIRNPVRYNQLNGTGNFSIFSTEMLEYQDVYAGNPPLIYGNSTAGLVDIKLRKTPNPDGLSLGASLANVSANWNKQFKDGKAFIAAFANHGLSSPFKLVNGDALSNINSFRNTDIGLRYYSQLSDNVTFSFFNYSTTEGYDVNYGIWAYQGNAIGNQIRNYTVAALEWGHKRNQWSINSGTNFSDAEFTYGAISSNAKRKDFYSSINYKRIEENFVLQSGLSYTWNQDSFDEVYPKVFYDFNENGDTFTSFVSLSQHDIQAYTYAKHYIGGFTFSAALRSNFPNTNQENFLSRQFAVKYEFDKVNTLLFSTGKYYNYNYPTSENPHQDLMQSVQYAIEYQYNTEDLKITLAGYTKEEDNILERFKIADDIPVGIRTIRGLEVSMKKNIGKRFILDLANTFLDVNVDAGDFTYRADNDLKYFFKLGLTLFNNDVFNAGLSYIHRPGKYYTDIVQGEQGSTDAYIPIFDSAINGSQYNEYSNLSITFNRQISLENGKSLVFYAVLNNVLNQQNQSYATYNFDFTEKSYEYLGKRWLMIGGIVSL